MKPSGPSHQHLLCVGHGGSGEIRQQTPLSLQTMRDGAHLACAEVFAQKAVPPTVSKTIFRLMARYENLKTLERLSASVMSSLADEKWVATPAFQGIVNSACATFVELLKTLRGSHPTAVADIETLLVKEPRFGPEWFCLLISIKTLMRVIDDPGSGPIDDVEALNDLLEILEANREATIKKNLLPAVCSVMSEMPLSRQLAMVSWGRLFVTHAARQDNLAPTLFAKEANGLLDMSRVLTTTIAGDRPVSKEFADQLRKRLERLSLFCEAGSARAIAIQKGLCALKAPITFAAKIKLLVAVMRIDNLMPGRFGTGPIDIEDYLPTISGDARWWIGRREGGPLDADDRHVMVASVCSAMSRLDPSDLEKIFDGCTNQLERELTFDR